MDLATMLLRRITIHVKDQNWFAVGVDFIIVVVGVFIGIQVSNWNETQRAKADEQTTVIQIAEEFTAIQKVLEKQIEVRKGLLADLGLFIQILEGNDLPEADVKIKAGLDAATSSGRLPPRSASYQQLTASGGLTGLSNQKLINAMINYEARIQRDAFLHSALVDLIVEELSSNPFVDWNTLVGRRGADVDKSSDKSPTNGALVRSYDFAGLQQFENRYEAIYSLQQHLLTVVETQMSLANEVLNQITSNIQE